MNSNAENTFDGFLGRKLNNVRPEGGLLATKLQVFLAERKDKRRRKILFWLFLFLALCFLLSCLFIFCNKTVFWGATNSEVKSVHSPAKRHTPKREEPRSFKGSDSTMLTGKSRQESDDSTGASRQRFAAISIDSAGQNKQNISGLKSPINAASVLSDSVTHRIAPIPKIQLQGADSLRRKTTKLKEDTFYIIW